MGIFGTEAGADWTILYIDMSTGRNVPNANSGNDETSKDAIPVPLYDLVYHDALVTNGGSDLRSWLLASPASLGRGGAPIDTTQVKRHAALQMRVALLEMTNHEFLNDKRTRERTTFADGTAVTVDWDTKSVEVTPELGIR